MLATAPTGTPLPPTGADIDICIGGGRQGPRGFGTISLVGESFNVTVEMSLEKMLELAADCRTAVAVVVADLARDAGGSNVVALRPRIAPVQDEMA